MDYTSETPQKPMKIEDQEVDVLSLYRRLETLPDQRQARGKRYPLAVVLVCYLLAKLAGEDYFSGIAEWVRERQTELTAALGIPLAGFPSHNTYRRILRDVVDLPAFQRVLQDFLRQRGADQGTLIAIDGKTLRGTIPPGQTQGTHVLSAYLPESGVVLGQIEVDQKENEITAAPQLLQALDLRGKIVMGDALHTQRALSRQIGAAGGEYIWYVKGNQPQTLTAIALLFAPESCAPGFSPSAKDFQTARQVNAGHGRLEERILTSSCLLQDYLDWPGVYQVFRLERRFTYHRPAKRTQEVVYGITSLSRQQASAERLLGLVRQYWGIENGLHYRRDRSLLEDRMRIKHQPLALAVACVNNLIVSIAAWQGFRFLPQARRHFAAHLSEALNLFLLPST